MANGTSLSTSAIGHISPSLPNIFVPPSLSTNLIFVSQLVEHDYNVQFSCYDCILQDQLLGKIILKGPKVG